MQNNGCVLFVTPTTNATSNFSKKDKEEKGKTALKRKSNHAAARRTV